MSSRVVTLGPPEAELIRGRAESRMAADGSRRILFANQTGQMSGAERSLLDLLDGLPTDIVPAVACPPGDLLEAVRARGISTLPLPGTDVSFRLHPLHTSRGLGWVARAASRLRSLGRRFDATLVHANTTRAGLPAAFASRTGGRPAVVHVRDWVPDGRFASATLRAIELAAAAVVTNSHFVARQFPRRRASCPVHVIHNPVDAARFDPEAIDRTEARAELGVPGDATVITVVAQLTPWKGQDDAVRMLARLKPHHPGLRLVLAGSAKFTAPGARFDNAAFERDLRAMVEELGLENDVVFAGERDDVPRVLRATDLLLVPSWQEAFGRIALEGMAMRLPVIATTVGGTAEVVRDGVDGALLPPRQPKRWAVVLAGLLERPDVCAQMGEKGRRRALHDFSIERHVAQVVSLYDAIASQRGVRDLRQ